MASREAATVISQTRAEHRFLSIILMLDEQDTITAASLLALDVEGILLGVPGATSLLHEAYLDIAQDKKSTLEEIHTVINDKDYAYTLSPEKVFKTAVFMGKVGTIKAIIAELQVRQDPAGWQDGGSP